MGFRNIELRRESKIATHLEIRIRQRSANGARPASATAHTDLLPAMRCEESFLATPSRSCSLPTRRSGRQRRLGRLQHSGDHHLCCCCCPSDPIQQPRRNATSPPPEAHTANSTPISTTADAENFLFPESSNPEGSRSKP